MINPFTHRKILKKGMPGTGTIVAMSMPHSGASSQNIAMTIQVQVEGMAPYEVEDQWMVNHRHTLGFGMTLPVKVDRDNPQKVAIDWDAAEANHAAETAARRAALAAQGPVEGAAIVDPLAGAAGGIAAMSGMSAMGAFGMDSMGSAFSGGTPEEPVLDLRNDPELREKLEKVLGRELVPGTQEHLDFSRDPVLAAQVMQTIAQHQAEKQMQALSGAGAGAGGAADPIGQLERLDALRQSGALTQEEFEDQKKRLLG